MAIPAKMLRVTDAHPELSFRFELRKYQRLMVDHLSERLAEPGDDERFHLVAPPGSGKTILGIEMIARLGEPAVVFAPTSTIQHQWVDKVRMFTETDQARDRLTNTRPGQLADINVFTYQLISTPERDQDLLRDAALEAWVDEAQERDANAGEAQARERIAEIRESNPQAFNRELRKRATRLRRELLREPSSDVERFLHPNARALIDELVAAGVRTIVLDECHHLLDYWAIVLAALIARIDKPRVIGLTATLPSLDDGNEYENYVGLLGDVDFEVPTPAVVKEGDLAPYRDLAMFVEPAKEERAYLADARTHFADAVTAATDGPVFVEYLREAKFAPGETVIERWEAALRDSADVAIAAARILRQRGEEPPAGALLPAESADPVEFTDTVAIVERFGLDHLKVSPHAADHERLATLKRTLRPFGYTLTERGLRQRRAPGELMITYSRAKAHATGIILGEEHAALGDRLRAVVVTDYESTGFAMPGDDKKSQRGSARAVFAALVHHPRAHMLDPVLVTGRTLWMDADHARERVAAFNAWLTERGLDAQCKAHASELPGIVEVQGAGRDWTSGTWVRMVTAMFESGLLQCLVGTRGLFAEGWDALTLSTLVDLTAVASSTTTQQLRGRALRVDPTWPDKLAHRWDVICYDAADPAGDLDVRRLARRHRHVWGVVPDYSGVIPEHVGRVVRGLDHVDPRLNFASPQGKLRPKVLTDASRRALQQVNRRERSLELWDVGSAYRNWEQRAARLEAPNLQLRTVATVTETLKRLLAEFRMFLVSGPIAAAVMTFGALTQRGARSWLVIGGALAVATVVAFIVALPPSIKVVRSTLTGHHPDLVVRDIALAVLGALQEVGLISRTLPPDSVVVTETAALTLDVTLENAITTDQVMFTAAVSDALATPRSQRYLVTRKESALPNVWLRPLWAVLRRVARISNQNRVTVHPVPTVLGRGKERAEIYHRHWQRHVGKGELIFTKNVAGWRRMAEARAQTQPHAQTSLYERWS